MKILVLSDLHYGFSRYTHTILEGFFKTLPNHDLCIISGDLISHDQTQWGPLLKLLKKYIPNFTFVRGNHDFWHNDFETRIKNMSVLFDRHTKVFKAAKVHYLPDRPIIMDNIIIVGFDGWYGSDIPPSKDSWMLPSLTWSESHIKNNKCLQQSPMAYLKNKSERDLNSAIKIAKEHGKDKIRICVTHHNPYSEDYIWAAMSAGEKTGEKIKENFNYIICGHNHQFRDDSHVKNCGSDYDKPKYLLFEVQ